MNDPRHLYLRNLSETVHDLRRIYARSSFSRDFSPSSNRRRLRLAEEIENLLRDVTEEEKKEYELW